MLLNKFRSVLSVHSVNCEFCTACIVAVVSVLRQSFCPSDRLTMAPPLDRNPLWCTIEYTLIHRELPKPSREQRRALNKQIKGRLTIVGPSNRRPTDKRGFDSLLLRHLPKENEERGIPGSLLHGEMLSSNINSVSVKINIDGL